MINIFITGASSGIGESMARLYARQGAQLGLVARRAEFLERIADELEPRPAVYALDVRDADALKAAATDFINRDKKAAAEAAAKAAAEGQTASAAAVAPKDAADKQVPLISATGSCVMGQRVAKVVHGRFGRTILELGGNNAVIVTPTADLDLAVRAIFFGAIGTAGQRCTSTRRVIVHSSVAKKLRARLLKAYASVRIGNPLERSTVMGPLIDRHAVEALLIAKDRVRREGGKILFGGDPLKTVDTFPTN